METLWDFNILSNHSSAIANAAALETSVEQLLAIERAELEQSLAILRKLSSSTTSPSVSIDHDDHQDDDLNDPTTSRLSSYTTTSPSRSTTTTASQPRQVPSLGAPPATRVVRASSAPITPASSATSTSTTTSAPTTTAINRTNATSKPVPFLLESRVNAKGFLEYLPDEDDAVYSTIAPAFTPPQQAVPIGFLSLVTDDDERLILSGAPIGFLPFLSKEERISRPKGFMSFLMSEDIDNLDQNLRKPHRLRIPSKLLHSIEEQSAEASTPISPPRSTPTTPPNHSPKSSLATEGTPKGFLAFIEEHELPLLQSTSVDLPSSKSPPSPASPLSPKHSTIPHFQSPPPPPHQQQHQQRQRQQQHESNGDDDDEPHQRLPTIDASYTRAFEQVLAALAHPPPPFDSSSSSSSSPSFTHLTDADIDDQLARFNEPNDQLHVAIAPSQVALMILNFRDSQHTDDHTRHHKRHRAHHHHHHQTRSHNHNHEPGQRRYRHHHHHHHHQQQHHHHSNHRSTSGTNSDLNLHWLDIPFRGASFILGAYCSNHVYTITKRLCALVQQQTTLSNATAEWLLSAHVSALQYTQNLTEKLQPHVLEQPRAIVAGARDERPVYIACGYNSTALVSHNGSMELSCANRLAGPALLGQYERPRRWCGSVTINELHGRKVARVACGAFHFAALTVDNCIFTWGSNRFLQPDGSSAFGGQLGHKETEHVCTPRRLQGFFGTIVDVACGCAHTVVLTTNYLYTFGANQHRQLGRSSALLADYRPSPVFLSVTEHYSLSSVTCGAWHTVLLTSCGRVFAFGANDSGQVGVPPSVPSSSSPSSSSSSSAIVSTEATPQHITNLPPHVVQIASGSAHNLCCTASGSVYAWGSNLFGELGTPASSDLNHATHDTTESRRFFSAEPIRVRALAAHRIVHVACGPNSSLALSDSGLVFVWGMLMSDGLTTHQRVPRPLASLNHQNRFVARLAAGFTHHVYMTDDAATKALRLLVQWCCHHASVHQRNCRAAPSLQLRLMLLAVPEIETLLRALQDRALAYVADTQAHPAAVPIISIANPFFHCALPSTTSNVPSVPLKHKFEITNRSAVAVLVTGEHHPMMIPSPVHIRWAASQGASAGEGLLIEPAATVSIELELQLEATAASLSQPTLVCYQFHATVATEASSPLTRCCHYLVLGIVAAETLLRDSCAWPQLTQQSHEHALHTFEIWSSFLPRCVRSHLADETNKLVPFDLVECVCVTVRLPPDTDLESRSTLLSDIEALGGDILQALFDGTIVSVFDIDQRNAVVLQSIVAKLWALHHQRGSQGSIGYGTLSIGYLQQGSGSQVLIDGSAVRQALRGLALIDRSGGSGSVVLSNELGTVLRTSHTAFEFEPRGSEHVVLLSACDLTAINDATRETLMLPPKLALSCEALFRSLLPPVHSLTPSTRSYSAAVLSIVLSCTATNALLEPLRQSLMHLARRHGVSCTMDLVPYEYDLPPPSPPSSPSVRTEIGARWRCDLVFVNESLARAATNAAQAAVELVDSMRTFYPALDACGIGIAIDSVTESTVTAATRGNDGRDAASPARRSLWSITFANDTAGTIATTNVVSLSSNRLRAWCYRTTAQLLSDSALIGESDSNNDARPIELRHNLASRAVKPSLRHDELIGRAAEMHQLERLLAASRLAQSSALDDSTPAVKTNNEPCHVIVVTGPSGSGKSALIQHVVRSCSKRDTTPHLVLATQAFQVYRHKAFSLWAPLLRHVVAADLSGAPDEQLARYHSLSLNLPPAVCAMLPLLALVIDDLPAPYLRNGAELHTLPTKQLASVIVAVLASFCNHRACVFVLEDIHWADAASLQLLTEIPAHLDSCVMLVSHRSLDDESMSQVHKVLESLQSKSVPVSQLTLGPLAPVDCQRLLSNSMLHASGTISPELQQQLLCSLRLHELPCYYHELGWCAAVSAHSMEELPPRSIEQLIHERIRLVSPQAQRFLCLASAVGSGIPRTRLLELGIASRSDFEMLEQELVDAALVRPRDSADLLVLQYDLIRDTAYSMLDTAQRAVLHHQLASCEQLLAHSCAVAAFHWFEALSMLPHLSFDDWSHATACIDRAAAELVAVGAPADARRVFHQLYRLLPPAHQESASVPLGGAALEELRQQLERFLDRHSSR